nr:membrane protein insertase YidC [Herbiconiux sp. VKM Ac-1786]
MQFLSSVLQPLAGGASAALAVVALTVLVRLVLIPVGVSQARAQRMRTRLAPRLAELQRRHRRDPQRLQRETMALYAAENASPLAGCLPLLLQAPVLSLVYGLFILPTINGHPNVLLTEWLLGAPLGTSFAAAVGAVVSGHPLQASAGLAVLPGSPDALPALVVTGVVLVLLAAVALVSRRVTLALAPTPEAAAAPGSRGSSAPQSSMSQPRGARSAGALPPAAPDLPAALAPGGSLQRALSWLPLMTVVIAAFVPLAAALYLLVTTTWTVAERALLHRLIR